MVNSGDNSPFMIVIMITILIIITIFVVNSGDHDENSGSYMVHTRLISGFLVDIIMGWRMVDASGIINVNSLHG